MPIAEQKPPIVTNDDTEKTITTFIVALQAYIHSTLCPPPKMYVCLLKIYYALLCLLNFGPELPVALLRKSNYAALKPPKAQLCYFMLLLKQPNFADCYAGVTDVSSPLWAETYRGQLA